MSAEAQARLQLIWEKLHFTRVTRTIARDPEDILSIWLKPEHSWMGPQCSSYNRVSDVPNDSEIDHISWRHYFGFTEDGVYFQQDDYHGLDLDVDLTMTWSRWANHNGGYERPEVGQLVCGEVIETANGKRFAKWFNCDEAFKLLVEAIRGDAVLSEEEFGRQLLIDGFPDNFWAIVRLVLFDNVQAFVDEYKLSDMLHDDDADLEFARHPAAGMVYGKHGFECDDYGMYLSTDEANFVHIMSYRFNCPQWWQEFLRLAHEQDVRYSHPDLGGYCKACSAEQRDMSDFDYRGGYGIID